MVADLMRKAVVSVLQAGGIETDTVRASRASLQGMRWEGQSQHHLAVPNTASSFGAVLDGEPKGATRRRTARVTTQGVVMRRLERRYRRLLAVVVCAGIASASVAGGSAVADRPDRIGDAAGYIGKHHLRLAPSAAAFLFGSRGGFARNVSITITNGNGVTVHTVAGTRRFQVPPNTAVGLLKLAEAVGFFSMGFQAPCSGGRGGTERPSVAYITINTTSGSTTVESLGECNPRFAQLFDVLRAVARISA